jgi:hypothetical protein
MEVVFAAFWQLFCFNSPDCSSWIMVSEVKVCVCVCVCVSLSLSLTKFHKRSTPHTTVYQPAASDVHFKLAGNTWGMYFTNVKWLFQIFLKNLTHLWIFFEFFQNQRITEGFGFFKKFQNQRTAAGPHYFNTLSIFLMKKPSGFPW